MSRQPDARCPEGHRHGATGTCYQLHGCRCAACTTKHATQLQKYRGSRGTTERTPKPRKRAAGASRFAEVPFAPIAPCIGEDAERVRRMIAKNAPAAECAELAAMLGVAA